MQLYLKMLENIPTLLRQGDFDVINDIFNNYALKSITNANHYDDNHDDDNDIQNDNEQIVLYNNIVCNLRNILNECRSIIIFEIEQKLNNVAMRTFSDMLKYLLQNANHDLKKILCSRLAYHFIQQDYDDIHILFIHCLLDLQFSQKELNNCQFISPNGDSWVLSSPRIIIAWLNLTSYVFPFDVMMFDNWSNLLIQVMEKAYLEKRFHTDRFIKKEDIEYLLDHGSDRLLYTYMQEEHEMTEDKYVINHNKLRIKPKKIKGIYRSRCLHHQYFLHALALSNSGLPVYVIMWIISDWLIPRDKISEKRAVQIVESVCYKRLRLIAQ